MDFFRTEPEEVELPGIDDSLERIHRQRSLAVTLIVVVAVVGLGWLAYSLQQGLRKEPLDEEMLARAELIQRAVMLYHADNAEYPSSLDEVVQYFPTDGEWPEEPYTFQPMHDTGSPVFDPATSAGMIHYEKIELTGKTGYRIYVFGRADVLEVLWGGYVVEL